MVHGIYTGMGRRAGFVLLSVSLVLALLAYMNAETSRYSRHFNVREATVPLVKYPWRVETFCYVDPNSLYKPERGEASRYSCDSYDEVLEEMREREERESRFFGGGEERDYRNSLFQLEERPERAGSYFEWGWKTLSISLGNAFVILFATGLGGIGLIIFGRKTSSS